MAAFTLAHLSDPHLPPLPAARLGDLAGKRALGYLNWTRNRHKFHRRDVLDALLPRYVEAQVYRAVLENGASEQAARMLAMRNASDNASEFIEDLTLTANKVRQASITTELMEIVGGAAALEG